MGAAVVVAGAPLALAEAVAGAAEAFEAAGAASAARNGLLTEATSARVSICVRDEVGCGLMVFRNFRNGGPKGKPNRGLQIGISIPVSRLL